MISSTESRLNKAKNQYENILLNLYLPTENEENYNLEQERIERIERERGGIARDSFSSYNNNNISYNNKQQEQQQEQEEENYNNYNYSNYNNYDNNINENEAEEIIISQQAEIEKLRSELSELKLKYEIDLNEARRNKTEIQILSQNESTRIQNELTFLKNENQQLKYSLSKTKSESDLYKQQLEEALKRILHLSRK